MANLYSPSVGGGKPAGFGEQYPAGYSPIQSSGLVSLDQTKASGAPAGYKWDPVMQKYVPTVGSAEDTVTQRNMQQAQQQKQSGQYDSVMSGLLNSLGSGGSRGGSSQPYASIPPVALTSSLSGNAPAHLAPVDTSGAEANAFARAKDKAGLIARGALTGLSGAMAGRGTVGSGVEGRAQAGIINQGQQNLGEVTREQAITGANLAQKNAEISYQGDIAQRGQDLSAVNAANQNMLSARSQDIAQRGQDIGAQEAAAAREEAAYNQKMNLVMQALSGLRGQMKY